MAHSIPCQFWQDMIKLNGGRGGCEFMTSLPLSPPASEFPAVFQVLWIFLSDTDFIFKADISLRCAPGRDVVRWQEGDAGLEALDSWLQTCRPSW